MKQISERHPPLVHLPIETNTVDDALSRVSMFANTDQNDLAFRDGIDQWVKSARTILARLMTCAKCRPCIQERHGITWLIHQVSVKPRRGKRTKP
jgi:hypothetical protein